MRQLLAVVTVALAALVAGPVQAADLPEIYYPPEDLPGVDYGLGGTYYLRGSLAGNAWWARESQYQGCLACGPGVITEDIDEAGYGYSFGAGVGYETGDGLRADVTVDYLHNEGLSAGGYTMRLRSTLGLANVYYDFPISGDLGSAAGGFGAYVGAGIGVAYNQTHSEGPFAGPDGANVAGAGALMAGVTYDMGSLVADLGYRMVYMPQITNGDAALLAQSPYYYNQNTIHELRGTVRYRFN